LILNRSALPPPQYRNQAFFRHSGCDWLLSASALWSSTLPRAFVASKEMFLSIYSGLGAVSAFVVGLDGEAEP
jgi:hypothetical protein